MCNSNSWIRESILQGAQEIGQLGTKKHLKGLKKSNFYNKERSIWNFSYQTNIQNQGEGLDVICGGSTCVYTCPPVPGVTHAPAIQPSDIQRKQRAGMISDCLTS